MIIIKEPVGLMKVNCYIVGDPKEAIVVDPGGDAEKIVRILNENNITAKYIVLTHCHFDHIIAVEKVMEKIGVKLIACQAEKENLLNCKINYTDRYSRKPIELTADIYVKENDVIKSGEYEFKVIETPGHTSGSMCLYCKEKKVLLSGDTLFYASVGRCDLATGDGQNLIKSIKEKLFILPDDTLVFAGHGEDTSIGFEKLNNPFVY